MGCLEDTAHVFVPEVLNGMTDRQTDTLRNLLYKLDVIIIFAHGDLNHILMFKSG